MKRTLLIVGAAFVLSPFLSADARANHDAEFASVEPTILLRCQQRHSSEHSSFEEEQIAHHTFHHESFTERQARQNSHIRDLLRQRQTSHSQIGSIASVPIVIEIQGDCNAIRVGIGAASQDELFPGEFDHLSDYEAWSEALRGHHRGASGLWLTRPGSGWDWFLRRRGNSIRFPAYPSESVPRDK
ncbi:MAG: hypothetical protein AAF703_10115 [Cyanobacteria bacterium P01_D01_bin.105]